MDPAPFKRVSHPPYARGGYNSEEWVFDDDDDDDEAAERYDSSHHDNEGQHHNGIGAADDGIRSLEVRVGLLLLFSQRIYLARSAWSNIARVIHAHARACAPPSINSRQ